MQVPFMQMPFGLAPKHLQWTLHADCDTRQALFFTISTEHKSFAQFLQVNAIPVTHAMHIPIEAADPLPHWVHEAIAAEHGAQSFLISACTTIELRGGGIIF